MRTVFLGTSEFAAAVLGRLAETTHRPALVVTRPDRPRGRGRRMAAPPVAATAAGLSMRVLQPESVNAQAARQEIAAVRPDVVCVCAFGALIKEPLLSAYPMLNVHPSLLPRWRGAAPIERAIMAGDEVTGVSIMRLTAGLDSGPVCAQGRESIHDDDSYGTLSARLQSLGADLLIDVLDAQPPCHEQDQAGVTYAEKIAPGDRLIDPQRPAAELERLVRALHPHIGAQLRLGDGAPLGVLEARALGLAAEGPAGALSVRDGRPVLTCAEGGLELVSVQPAGRRAMSGADFVRGRRDVAGR